jgi:hypothetical protein
MKRTLCLLCLIASSAFAGYRYPVGERAVYKIMWGPLSCGTSIISCDEIELGGQPLIRIRIQAKSNKLVSTIYPVDDMVDCFIDPKTSLSVRLEKHTSEGGFVCKDILRLNREENTAFWVSQSGNISTNYPIDAEACDAVSFLYAFRQHDFQKNEARNFRIAVDSALHGITITAKGTDSKKIGNAGEVACRKYIARSHRDDLFVRKIPEEIWLTDDDRKILARMDVKVPVGKARIVLVDYTPPLAEAGACVAR